MFRTLGRSQYSVTVGALRRRPVGQFPRSHDGAAHCTTSTPPARLTIQGGCLCGDVRFELATAPLYSYYCHCNFCRRWSGSVAGTWLTVPVADFEFTALPFDKQTLFVDLESYRMPSEAVQLEWDLSGANGIDKDFNNVEWQFLDIDPDPPPSAKKDHPFSQNDRSDLDELVERTLPSRGNPAVVAGVGASACIKSFCSSSCPLLCRAGNRQYEGDTKQFSRVSYVIYLKRHVTQWILGYIVTSVLLLFASYLGLFIKNDNPGRPA